VEQNTLIKSEL